MALQKSKTLPNGAVGDYWKITEVSCRKLSMLMSAKITLFKDESFRMKQDLGLSKTFLFKCTREQLAGDLTALAYALIKAKALEMIPGKVGQPEGFNDPDLANATDV